MTPSDLLTTSVRSPRKHATALDGPARRECGRAPDAARDGARIWQAFKRLTELGFPRHFPIVQFPNLPLIVAFAAGEAGQFVHGADHAYTASVAYLAMTIWAYEELTQGVNWFRRLLGAAYMVIMVARVAHALHA